MKKIIEECLDDIKEDRPLMVSWIPQVPMKPFQKEISSVKEGYLLLETLADYDIFQYENQIKPDFSNAGELLVFDVKEGEWEDWMDEEGLTIDEYVKELEMNLE